MEVKYLLLILGIASVTKINAHQIEFQNPQVVDYDEESSSYLGEIDVDGFQQIGKNYYWMSELEVGWWDAYYRCKDLNSSLVNIETVEELELLSAYLLGRGKEPWVGANDYQTHGTFRWLESDQKIPAGGVWWTSGQPDKPDGTEHCAQLWQDGTTSMFRHNNWNCVYITNFICERQVPKGVSAIVL